MGYAQYENVTGTAAVLEAARRAGVSRIVFGSSSSVYGDSTPAPFREDAVAIEPVSPYAATKRAGESLPAGPRADPGFPERGAAVLHRVRAAPAARSRHPRLCPADGRWRGPDFVRGRHQSRDYTYCDYIAAGVVAAVDWTASAPAGMEVFNLGGNRTVPTGVMVAEIAGAMGIEPRIQWVRCSRATCSARLPT